MSNAARHGRPAPIRATLVGLLVSTLATAVLAQTDHSGTCTGTFAVAGNPHRLTSTCMVPAEETLTLEPGVVLQSTTGTQTLMILGTLNSGDNGAMVSIQDVFLDFRDGSTGTVQHTSLSGSSARIGISGSTQPTDPTIADCVITTSSVAIDVSGTAQPTITDNMITTNSVGIRYSGNSAGEVSGNQISFASNASANRVGINVDGSATPIIDDNTIGDDPLRADVAIDVQNINPGTRVQVTNNTIEVSGTDTPLLLDVDVFALGADVTITGNEFPDGLAAGLQIGAGTMSVDSRIDAIDGIAALFLDAGFTVDGATLTIASGIAMAGNRAIVVRNGQLDASSVSFQDVQFDFQVGSAGTIQQCVLAGNSRFTIRGDSVDTPASPIITENDMDVGTVVAFDVQNTATPMITNNNVRVNSTAFRYLNSGAGRAEGNTITFPSGAGSNRTAFNVDAEASPTLSNNIVLDDPTRNDIGFDLTNITAASAVVITNNEVHVSDDDRPFLFGTGVFLLASQVTIDGNTFPDGLGGGARIASGTLNGGARIAEIDGFTAYRLDSNVIVGGGTVLTIAAGIALENGTLRVDGTLNANDVDFAAMTIEYRLGSGGALTGSTLTDAAIRLIGTSNETPAAPTISGNIISGGFGTLIDIQDTAAPMILNNTIRTNGTGILARESSGGSITGNRFEFPSGLSQNRIALNVDANASPVVSDNLFDDDETRDDVLIDLTDLSPTSTVSVTQNRLCATGGDRPFVFGGGFFGVAMNATVADNDFICQRGAGLRLAGATYTGDTQLKAVNGESTFTLDNQVTVGGGVILTIPEGIRIDGSRTLRVEGTVNADGVELTGPFLDFVAGGGGTIRNSSLTAGARVRVTDASPSFVGNLFAGANPAIDLSGQTDVLIDGNTFVNNMTAIRVNGPAATSTVEENVFDANTQSVTLVNAGALFSALPDLETNDFLGTSDENTVMLPFTIDASGTLPSLPVAYRAQGLNLSAGSTMTIEPGVAIQNNEFTAITVGGRMIAEGLPDLPIVFTAFQAKQGRRWDGLRFDNQGGAAASVLEGVIVEFAGRGGNAGIRLDNADISIGDCVVADNAFDGIRVQNGSAPTITGCAIANNMRHGVSVSADSNPVINVNSIFGNLQSGVTVDDCPDGSVLIDAADNFWGDDSGPFDNSNDTAAGGLFNPLGQGDTVSDCVGYVPFTGLGPTIEGVIVLISGQDQTGMLGEVLPDPLVVEVRDLVGAPLEGIDVTFTLVEGDASIVEEQPIPTGDDGRAAATVLLGDTPGGILIAVSAVDVNSPFATFMAEGNGAALFTLSAEAPPDWVCPGDCDGGGGVSVGELLRGVNIALGRMPLAACPAMDRGDDGAVDVEELIEAVAMSLGSCAEAP